MYVDCVNSVLQIIIYVLAIVLLIALIIFTVKGIKTLKKVDAIMDDLEAKSQKLNGIFEIIDYTTEVMTSVTEKLGTIFSSGIMNLFTRKKRKKEEKKDE